MSKFAWLFPGQGSQKIGMCQHIINDKPTTNKILDEANSALGIHLSDIIENGPQDKLDLTEYAQPAILTHSIMVVEAFGNMLPQADFFAGHSLGEYSALVASKAITFVDAIKTVYERGKAMQSAIPYGIGGMTAIIGANQTQIENACKIARLQTNLWVSIANFNNCDQIVISGHNQAIDVAITIIKDTTNYQKIVKLQVSAPFHSQLMEPAKLHMTNIINNLKVSVPINPIINNINAEIVCNPSKIKSGLINQISNAVQWEATINLLIQLGVTTFFELGHGTILKNIIKRHIKKIGLQLNIHSISSMNDFLNIQKMIN